jgi:integrase
MLLKRKFKPLLKALSIQVPLGVGSYILRHGNATLMSSFGAPQKLRQERLGHADESPVTETIYAHMISEDEKRVGTQLGSTVCGISKGIGRQLGVSLIPPFRYSLADGLAA